MDWSQVSAGKGVATFPDLASKTLMSEQAWAADYIGLYELDFVSDNSSVAHYFGAFDSGAYRIACQVFCQQGADTTVYIYHGYYDHTGLYSNVIEFCLKQGFSVVVYDLPGHGLSSGERAAISDFMMYRQVLRDALVAVAPFDLPVQKYAMAQSTGCAVLMSHLLDGGVDDFSKVVLFAPLLRPRAWRKASISHAILKYFLHHIPRSFANNSQDQEFVEFIANGDPLQPRILPISWVGALKKWVPWFLGQARLEKTLLIIQGDADNTVDWRFNVPKIEQKFVGAKTQMIAGANHHLVKEGESFRQQMFAACDEYFKTN
ncbi:MAG: alpha/beta fold hydrolase [Spongiibacteraceae bacterium]